jgi:tetratricopeptide (TPR) repeat protein
MAIIYKVTVEPGESENRFHVTWHNVGTDTADSFDRSAEVTPEETQRLWQYPRHQLEIGRKLFRFLDGDARHLQRALAEANQQGESLQIHLHACDQAADWPFELLAREDTFLVPHGLHLVRRVSDWGKEKKVPPWDRPLKLLFMACSALDVEPELDFEREEEAIFRITEKLAIDMEVDDSGSLEGLRGHLEQEQYDVVHLSGHANIAGNGRPYFIMEDETGNAQPVCPAELWNGGLIENPPRLLFLSGCRTGETPDSGAAVSFARMLAENRHIQAVLGWGRPVADEQAIHAEKIFYHELSRGRTILDAVQRTRYELTEKFHSSPNPAWPLLRLFSSGMPLNAVVTGGQHPRPKPGRMVHVYLKQSQVQVLAEGFVGRRRPLQTSLRTLKQDFDKVGVLILGSGGLGKSCLAGKICERFSDYTLIIVHGKLNAITLEAALKEAFILARDENGQKILEIKKEMTKRLADLCVTSFKEKNYLLLLDDFEQNLEGFDKGEPGPLRLEAADLMKALLHWLPHSGKMTQSIITGRYEFSLTEQDRDLVNERLEKVRLTGFQESERRKKARELKNILNYKDQSLVPHLLWAGRGNPRLMEWLDVLVGKIAGDEVPQLLKAIADKQEEFIRKHMIKELLQCGGDRLARFLSRLSIFRRPTLKKGFRHIAEKAGPEGWEELLKKGMGLSLIEHDRARRTYQLTPLLREELFSNLEDPHSCHQAAFTYYKEVCEGRKTFDPILTEEWIYHALGCGEEETASDQGGRLVKHLRERLAFRESRRVGQWILAEKKQELVGEYDAFLLNETAAALDCLGEYERAVKYYQQALDIDRSVYGESHYITARDLNNLGSAWRYLGDPGKAIDYYEQALRIVREAPGDRYLEMTGTILNNVGSARCIEGDFRKAIDYYNQALAIWEKVYGERHPHVAVTLNNLGAAWTALDNHQKAVECYEKALSIDRSLYGEQHPGTAADLNNLGMAWHKKNDPKKAAEYYRQALVIWKKFYGEMHPHVAGALNNLGEAYFALGEKEISKGYFEEAYKIFEKFSPGHPQTKSLADWLKEFECHS